MRNFIKSIKLIAGYSAILIIAKLLAFFANFVLAASLSSVDFGYISLAQALFMAADGIFGFNAQSAFVRFSYFHGAGAVLRALAPVYAWMLTSAVLTGLAIVTYFGADSLYVWFALIPLGGVAVSHLASSNAIARITNNLAAYALGEISRPGLLLLFVLMFFLISPSMAVGPFYIIALFFSGTVATTVGWASQWHVVREHRADIETSHVVGYIAPLLGGQLVSLANNYGDRFFLAAWMSIEDVGLYGKAYLAGSTFGTLCDSIFILWAPFIVKHREKYAIALHPWVRRLYSWSWIVALCVLSLAWSVSVIGNPLEGYLSTRLVTVGLIVTAAFVLRIGYQVCVPILSAFDRTPTVARLTVVSALVGLIANVCLIHFLGVHGAAFATLMAFAVFATGAYLNVLKLLGSSSNQVDLEYKRIKSTSNDGG